MYTINCQNYCFGRYSGRFSDAKNFKRTITHGSCLYAVYIARQLE